MVSSYVSSCNLSLANESANLLKDTSSMPFFVVKRPESDLFLAVYKNLDTSYLCDDWLTLETFCYVYLTSTNTRIINWIVVARKVKTKS